jgi:hypothetical protein
MIWSDSVNGFLYEFVALVLQASQAHNITIPGCPKYNVPSGNITLDDTIAVSYPNKTSYSDAAIAGVDNFNDDNTTIREIFDVVVEVTRELTPTGELSIYRPPMPVHFRDPSSSIKWEVFGPFGTYEEKYFEGVLLKYRS